MMTTERLALMKAIDQEAHSAAALAHAPLSRGETLTVAEAQVYATLALERRLLWHGLALAPGGHLPESQDAAF